MFRTAPDSEHKRPRCSATLVFTGLVMGLWCLLVNAFSRWTTVSALGRSNFLGRGKYHACRSVCFHGLYRDAAKKMLLPSADAWWHRLECALFRHYTRNERSSALCSWVTRYDSQAFWMVLLWVHGSKMRFCSTGNALSHCLASAVAKYQARAMFT